MKNLFFLAAVLMVLSFLPACQNEHGKNYNYAMWVDQDGLHFIKNGLEGGLAEIKASGLAITKSSNQKVIDFAKMMIKDHTQAGEKLKKIESDDQVEGHDTVGFEHEKTIAKLAADSGATFDKAYMQMMVNDHEKAIVLFVHASHNTNVTIRTFAAKTLPVIKEHLESANAIYASLK